jgi:hypothetical protein
MLATGVVFLLVSVNLFANDSSELFNPSKVSISDAEKSDLLCLGYRIETDRLFAPDGHTVRTKEYERLTKEPFDYKDWILSNLPPATSADEEETKIRQRLAHYGYRLDPETRQALSAEYKVLNNFEGQCWFKSLFGKNAKPLDASIDSAAAKILSARALCAKSGNHSQKCTDAVKALRKRLDLYIKFDPALKNLSDNDILKQEEISRRYFDGQNISALEKVASGKYDTTLKSIAIYNNTEQELSRRLQEETIKKLSQNPEGRKVLNRLKVNGKIHLPPIFVLKTFNSGALYGVNHQGERIILNADDVFPKAIDQRTDLDTKQKEALKKKLLSNFKLGERYLLDHPNTLKIYFKQHDNILAHELTHTWQERKDHQYSLAYAGLIPDRDYIEQEQEAFLTETRYLTYDFLKDPQDAMNHPDFNDRLPDFVHNLKQWIEGIKKRYLGGESGMPQKHATLQDAEEIVKAHINVDTKIAEKASRWTVGSQWVQSHLVLKVDAKALDNVKRWRQEYAHRINKLIKDSTALREAVVKKGMDFNITQADRTQDLDHKLAFLGDALMLDDGAKLQVRATLKKAHLSPEQAVKRLLQLAKNMALQNPSRLSQNQDQNLQSNLSAIYGIAALSPSNTSDKYRALLQSKVDNIWYCGMQAKNCQSLKGNQ